MSTSDETFHAALRARTSDVDPSTVIVLRRGLGQVGRVWLTFNVAIKTTVVMTDSEAGQLVGLLGEEQSARCVTDCEPIAQEASCLTC